MHAPADVAASIRHRYHQVSSCLGLEPASRGLLLDKGAFLLPSFVDAVRGANSSERLHALREDLIFRLRRDTAMLVEHLRRPYLVLVVDEARASVDGPTRVYVYDLPARRLVVLRARGEGTDVRVIPFRMAGLPSPPPRSRPLTGSSVSGHDCSVANATRQVLGVAPMGHAPRARLACAGRRRGPRRDGRLERTGARRESLTRHDTSTTLASVVTPPNVEALRLRLRDHVLRNKLKSSTRRE